MKHPTISIITPSLNDGRRIETCIQSVLAQEYPSFEHIIVDGGSWDETLNIVKKYHHLIWISEADRGQAHAINRGFTIARGDLQAWLNCDDEYRPGAFMRVAEAAEETGGQAVILGMVELYFEDKPLRVMKNHTRSLFRFLQPWIPYTNISQPGVFIPRRILKRAGPLDEALYYAMDLDLLCRLMRQNTPFHRVNHILARYNMSRQCKTGRGWHCLYPESDRVSLQHAKELTGFQRLLFLLSFHFLRPGMRTLYKVTFPPVF